MANGIPKPARIMTVRDKNTKTSVHNSKFVSPVKSNGNQAFNYNDKNRDYINGPATDGRS